MGNNDLVPLGEIYFGKLDAYSEFLEYGKDKYQDLFYASPSFHVEKFLEGKSYYIHGDKGVGKTALLKHIEIVAISSKNLVEYIRFKKEIDEEERNALKRAGIPQNTFEEVIDKTIPDDVGISCVYAWQVYIIKCIVNRICREETAFFVESDEWNKLKKLIKSAYKNDVSPVKKILPKIKRGTLKLEISDCVELGADFEWENNGEKTVSFSVYAKKVIELFGKLKKADQRKLYILFDELELVYFRKKSYLRDTALIRDLIQAIYYINEISKEKGYSVFAIACIRNEVYRSVAAIGYELNKLILDYGIEVSWLQSGGSTYDNPLIKMLINRLINSQPIEKRNISESDIWLSYFDEFVNINYPNQTSMNYVLDQTWNKPRDVIRLFTLIQQKYEGYTRISNVCFESVRKQYSQAAWEEFSNELSAKYSPEEIDGIKQVLIGIGTTFSLEDFSKKINEKAKHFKSVSILQEKRLAAEILQDIYQVGIIGTERKWKRFSFKGDQDFDSTASCIIHYPLRRFFSI